MKEDIPIWIAFALILALITLLFMWGEHGEAERKALSVEVAKKRYLCERDKGLWLRDSEQCFNPPRTDAK